MRADADCFGETQRLDCRDEAEALRSVVDGGLDGVEHHGFSGRIDENRERRKAL